MFGETNKGGEELHADGMQMSRTVWIVHVAHLLEEDATLPRSRRPAQR